MLIQNRVTTKSNIGIPTDRFVLIRSSEKRQDGRLENFLVENGRILEQTKVLELTQVYNKPVELTIRRVVFIQKKRRITETKSLVELTEDSEVDSSVSGVERSDRNRTISENTPDKCTQG